MASIILSTIGSNLGGAIGGPIGSYIGGRIGQIAGGMVDRQVFSGNRKLSGIQGPRLTDLAVQTSTYGKMIPIVYGTVRIAGNIIWATSIKETVTTTTSSAGGGGKAGGGSGRVTQTTTTYSYSVSLALAICEGPIDVVLRVWADAKQLDLSQGTYRIYTGTEDQLPDSFMQGIEGSDKTPAYRGLAYIVVEDFPLADYGNRIPNFTFEVKKKAQYPDYEGQILEEMVESMIMIPGAGEFVYDTTIQYKIPGEQVDASWVQQGNQERINMHNPYGKANALVSLDQLKDTCPNVGWVAVVVSWFGDSMDAGECIIKPGVEYQTGGITTPSTWQVAGFTRGTARQITMIDEAPQYGGTPDDASLLRYLDELKLRGYNIMFYPMLFMDVEGKPWRGLLTGSAPDVANFFTKTNGFNAFISHYANLMADRVDAFVIGSELIGLTKVTDAPGNYPAVNELVDLAAIVKSIVGDVQVTYAADWSEYHHTDGGWYNMDPLWASPDIDMVGIDAYFPLTDTPQNTYDVDTIKAGWTSGEGYNFYYTDAERTIQAPLDPPYAWKNIEWFWQNTHTNPDSSVTDWVPESKKIWFTEYGFPSVDNASNQPNVFYDPSTSGSAFPRFSKGRVDFRAQRAGLLATESQWQSSDMVERKFLWTWDARPYPYWPDLNFVWNDGGAWKTGHWVQGKLGVSSLAAIVSDLCQRTGLLEEDINVTHITDQVEGYVIAGQQTVRASIEQLQQGYFFDSVESDNVLKFVPRGAASIETIANDDLIPATKGNSRETLTLTRAQEIELPRRVNVIYLNRLANYQAATQYAQRETTSSRETVTVDLPIVFSDQVAKTVADVTLYTNWIARNSYEFSLPIKYAHLEPTDVIEVEEGNFTHRMHIVSNKFGSPGTMQIKAVAEDISAYDFYTAPGESPTGTSGNQPIADTRLELLDIPAFPQDDATMPVMRMAATGYTGNWRGSSVFRSDDGGSSYGRFVDINTAGIIGTSVNALGSGPSQVFDDLSTVTVTLFGNAELQNVTTFAILNGANAAMLGDEIIQFTTATLIEPNKYILSGLLRGRLGTEHTIDTHVAVERFIVLDGRILKQDLALNLLHLTRLYKPVSVGNTLTATVAQSFAYHGVSLKPYSPVHITAERDGSDNILISWVRRTRINGDWLDNVDIPLNETAEAYEIDIFDGDNVVRTLSDVATASATYTAAEQITDFGSAQSSVDIRVYQLSGSVGRGYPGIATV